MTKAETLRAKILKKPTPNDIKSAELRAFLAHVGMVEKKTGKTSGSRIRFYNPANQSEQIRLHDAHGSDPIDVGALKDVIKSLKLFGLI